ncbi:MAG: BON domain-containing protein [Pyrinomonadaceae bacterium]
MKFRIFTLTIALVSVAGLVAACGDTTTTSNNSRANVTNLGANNANTGAIVLNANANSNMNSNRWSNANVSRADYDKTRSDYERDKGSSTIGSGANDSWLWFKTRAALLTTSDLRESTINVDVVNDVVTLKGTVANAAEKTKAEQVAKGIDGVKSVKNELKVAPNDSMTNTSGNSSNMNKR